MLTKCRKVSNNAHDISFGEPLSTNPNPYNLYIYIYIYSIDRSNTFSLLTITTPIIPVVALDLGNSQRFRGTKRFILKALCRQALCAIDIPTALSPNFREYAYAAIVADF